MQHNMVRRTSALAIAVVVGLGAGLVNAVPATAAPRSAAGRYTATFPATATTSSLVVTAATGSTTSGTFEFTSFGDFGTWVAQGRTVAFLVAASSVGHEGSVLIAHLAPAGLTPGRFDEPGAVEQAWSATRVADTAVRVSSVATPHVAVRPQAAHPFVYDAVFDGTVDDTLTTVHSDGTQRSGIFGLSNLHDLGVWTKLGKKIVLGITFGDDAGIVLIGTQTKTTIGTPDAPGAYYQQDTGVHPWYANRRP